MIMNNIEWSKSQQQPNKDPGAGQGDPENPGSYVSNAENLLLNNQVQ